MQIVNGRVQAGKEALFQKITTHVSIKPETYELTRKENMFIHPRKFPVILLFVILFGLAIPFRSVHADAGGVVTPQDLQKAGWVCVYRFNQYAYCMNPNFKGLGPTTIMNHTYLVDGSDFKTPVYLGTSIFIRADKYANQPYPTNASPDWMLALDNLYDNCRHFEQPYL